MMIQILAAVTGSPPVHTLAASALPAGQAATSIGFLLLLMILAWYLRRHPGRIKVGGGGALKVVDSLMLSPKTRLVMVESDGNRVLLAVGGEQMTVIGTAAPFVSFGEPYFGVGREAPNSGEVH